MALYTCIHVYRYTIPLFRRAVVSLQRGMTYASGTLETPKGKITVSLRREGERVMEEIVALRVFISTGKTTNM